MRNSKVSIIIPIYNVEKYIEECVESIVKQTYNNIEIILIDDGSKDNSPKICDELAKKYNNIVLKHVENSGVSAARNLGLSIAKGKYIMFVDSDDFIDKDMVFSMVNEIEKNNSEMVACNYKFCYQNRAVEATFNAKKVLNRKEAKIELLESNSIRGFLCNKIFISDIIKKNNIKLNEEIKICEDLLFCFNYIENINKITTLNKPLYNYRMRKSSATNQDVEKDLSIFTAYEEMYKIDNNIYLYNKDFYAYIYFKYYKQLAKSKMLDKVKNLNFINCIFEKDIKLKTKIYITLYLILPKKIRNNIKRNRKQNLQFFE